MKHVFYCICFLWFQLLNKFVEFPLHFPSEKSFDENISNFKTRLWARGYPHKLIEKITSEVKFTKRKSALQQTVKVRKKILPFVTTYHPVLPNLKNILMNKCHFIDADQNRLDEKNVLSRREWHQQINLDEVDFPE